MCGVFLPICSSVQDVVASPDRVGLTAGLADSGKRSGDPACPQSEGERAGAGLVHKVLSFIPGESRSTA